MYQGFLNSKILLPLTFYRRPIEKQTSVRNDIISFSNYIQTATLLEKLRVLSQSHPNPMAELTYFPISDMTSTTTPFLVFYIADDNPSPVDPFSIQFYVYICNSTPRKSPNTHSLNPMECQGKCIMYLWYSPHSTADLLLPFIFCLFALTTSVWMKYREDCCWYKEITTFCIFSVYLWQVGSGNPRSEMWMLTRMVIFILHKTTDVHCIPYTNQLPDM